MTNLISFLIVIVVMMMVPKIISGTKEAIKFGGRVLGWGLGAVILYILISSLI